MPQEPHPSHDPQPDHGHDDKHRPPHKPPEHPGKTIHPRPSHGLAPREPI